MTKDVIISILGNQNHLDSSPDEIQMMTTGTLTVTDRGYELRYEETEVTGMVGTTTVILIEGARVTLMRTGEICSQMVFEEGRRHHSIYSTPYGDLEIGIATRHLLSTVSQTGGTLEIDYSMEIDHGLAGYNSFRISVREKG